VESVEIWSQCHRMAPADNLSGRYLLSIASPDAESPEAGVSDQWCTVQGSSSLANPQVAKVDRLATTRGLGDLHILTGQGNG